tara:strand:+ start:76 stop:495 length:420 start_codon:yes stop_codon:yes gene_type:complete
MDKEKNINDLLSSIRKLINEAHDEVLNIQNKNNLISIESTPSIEGKKTFEKYSVKKTNQNYATNDSINTNNQNNKKLSWENINFEKYQKEILVNKNELSENINKYFHQLLDNWVEKKLSKLIDVEVQVYAKNKLKEKLK